MQSPTTTHPCHRSNTLQFTDATPFTLDLESYVDVNARGYERKLSNQNCFGLVTSVRHVRGSWNDLRCERGQPFVCKRAAATTVATTAATTVATTVATTAGTTAGTGGGTGGGTDDD
jgi:hypothetical protein